MDAAPDLRTLRIGALLNTSSGSCDLAAEATLETCFAEASLTPVRVWCGAGDIVDSALDEIIAENLDVLVVVGGDGTIRAAAQRCGGEGPILAPLPGGTMNMLPKTLYGGRSWPEALRDTLADPALQTVHGGIVGGHRFFVAGIFGESSRFADAREAMREGNLADAIGLGAEAMRKAIAHELSYRFPNGPPAKAEAVAVMCPLTSAALTDEEEVLEAAAIDIDGPIDAVRLALAAAFAGWRTDRTVETARVKSLDLASDAPIPAILDGERFTFEERIRVEFVHEAFVALRPQGDRP